MEMISKEDIRAAQRDGRVSRELLKRAAAAGLLTSLKGCNLEDLLTLSVEEVSTLLAVLEVTVEDAPLAAQFIASVTVRDFQRHDARSLAFLERMRPALEGIDPVTLYCNALKRGIIPRWFIEYMLKRLHDEGYFVAQIKKELHWRRGEPKRPALVWHSQRTVLMHSRHSAYQPSRGDWVIVNTNDCSRVVGRFRDHEIKFTSFLPVH